MDTTVKARMKRYRARRALRRVFGRCVAAGVTVAEIHLVLLQASKARGYSFAVKIPAVPEPQRHD